jgi:hypothetical protein
MPLYSRPQHAAGTAKAAEDGWQLGEAMKAVKGDVLQALDRWEPGQLALGQHLVGRSREAGSRLQLAGGGRESHCHSACRRETVASGSEHRWCTRWMAVAYSIIANHRGKSPMVFPYGYSGSHRRWVAE